MIYLLIPAIIYVVGGFIYAGNNAMIDMNWAYKFYKDMRK